jgi:hypothetical protein
VRFIKAIASFVTMLFMAFIVGAIFQDINLDLNNASVGAIIGSMLLAFGGVVLMLVINYCLFIHDRRAKSMKSWEQSVGSKQEFIAQQSQIQGGLRPTGRLGRATEKVRVEIQRGSLQTLQDCDRVIAVIIGDPAYLVLFDDQLDRIRKQISRFLSKRKMTQDFLSHAIGVAEHGYTHAISVLVNIEQLLFTNSRSVLTRLILFDEKDYWHVRDEVSKGNNREVWHAKLELYKEFFDFTSRGVDFNDEVLLRLDELVSEMSKLKSFTEVDIDNLSVMSEIKALISETNLYGGV